MSQYLHNSVQKAFLGAIGSLLFLALQATSSQGATVTLNWNAQPNIAGYRLYYGTASRAYTQVIDVGNLTTVAVPNLSVGTVYFFAATVYNAYNIESTFSSEVSYAPPLQTPTPTPPSSTPTPGPVTIDGTIAYCTESAPGPVPNVTLTLTGSGAGSTLSTGSGTYQFSSLASGGSYTVTPTKNALPPGAGGITTVDVIGTQRHFLNHAPLPPGCPVAAGDVNGDGAVTTIDVIAIQRFFLGLTTGIANTGKYQFSPASRTYSAAVGNQTGQNYSVLIFGDVAGPFAELPEDPSQFPNANDGRVAEVALPEVAVESFVTTFSTEVTTTTINASEMLVGFQGNFSFDERVIAFQDEPVQKAGLTSGNWNVSANVLPGTGPIRTLRISAYSNDLIPLSGSGTLFNLNMIRVDSTPGVSTALTWATPGPEEFVFISGGLEMQAPGNTVPGAVTLETIPDPNPDPNPEP